jgi:hypothetical protein
MQQSTEEGASGENNHPRVDDFTSAHFDAAHPVAIDSQACNLSFDQGHARKSFDHPPQEKCIGFLVALRSRAPHRRPTRLVKRSELNACAVGRPTLEPAEGVDLGHQVPLADASNGRVARHLTDGVSVEGHEDDRRSHSGRCRCRLAPRVTATHHDQISSHCLSYFPMQNPL